MANIVAFLFSPHNNYLSLLKIAALNELGQALIT
jgi:hypothetical protein